MSVKSSKILMLSAALLFAAALSAPAQYRPLYYREMPKVSASYDTVLQKTWEGIKKRNVDAYTTGLVHRPKSNQPHDAVSEGVAYGMFLALYCNDQPYFNKIWDAGEKTMWTSEGTWGNSGNYYDWRVNRGGEKTGTGPASDADQDIALLLIFADRLVKNNIWTSHTSSKGAGYAARARDILQTVRTSMVENNYLLPGHWGNSGSGDDTKNPGYFAPAFYRIFAEFDSTNSAAWMALVDGSYELIAKSPGYAKGLIPDWCKMDGTSTGGAGYNAYFDGDALYRDAIRVYWRLATDYLWYKEPRAKAFLDKAVAFLEDSHGGAEGANFFDMSGKLLPEEDTEILAIGDGDIERKRREHSHLTAGMWAAAAMASGGAEFAESYSASLLKFYQTGTDYWGYAVDPSGGTEDTLRNEMYFDQFLAWFGASILGGTFTNVWNDLKSGVPAGPLAWKTRPPSILPNWDINAEEAPLRLGASFNRSAAWTVTLTHESAAGQVKTFADNSDTVSVVWYGLSDAGAYMTQGYYTLTLNAGGLNYTTEVWLGKPYAGDIPNLLSGRHLLVDDFADSDIYPYIGNVWRTYSDKEHDNGKSDAVMTVTNAGGGGKQLNWAYTLDRGNFQWEPYIALEWNCRTSSGETIDLRGIDSVIVTARSGTRALGVSVQLISSDFDIPREYHFFEDSINLTTTSREYGLRLSTANFRQRFADHGAKNFDSTLAKMIGIRFQLQYNESAAQSSDAIIVERIYFAGPNNVLSRLYTPPADPPEYIPPTREPISVSYRADRNSVKYSIKRGGNTVRVTLPKDMFGASARIVDVRGRTVKRANVPRGGSFDISVKNLAAGMYFMEIRKPGRAAIKVRIGNIR